MRAVKPQPQSVSPELGAAPWFRPQPPAAVRTARPRLSIARRGKRAAHLTLGERPRQRRLRGEPPKPHHAPITPCPEPQLTTAAARHSFSHGSYEYHGEVIANARQSQVDFPMGGKPVAIALDTKGPEIRTGMLVGDDVELVKGASLTVHTDDAWKEKGDASNLHMDYKNICKVSEYRRVCGGKGRRGGGGVPVRAAQTPVTVLYGHVSP